MTGRFCLLPSVVVQMLCTLLLDQSTAGYVT